MINVQAQWATETTGNSAFGYDPAYGVYCAFVDAGDIPPQPIWAGVLGRIAAAAALVFATFNPFGKSWFHWVILPMIQQKRFFLDPFKVLAGILR